MVALAAGALLGSLAALVSGAGGETAVTARVLDRGGLGPRIVGDAEKVVDRAFARSGVTFVWRSCDPTGDLVRDGCVGPAGPRDVSIRIAGRDPGTGGRAAAIEGGCAIALRVWANSGIVYVYSDRVQSVAQEGNVPPALVLGTIVAHEIGHLLLPGGHAPRGLMRALITRREWTLAEEGRLEFTPVQVDELRGAAGPVLPGPGTSQEQDSCGEDEPCVASSLKGRDGGG